MAEIQLRHALQSGACGGTEQLGQHVVQGGLVLQFIQGAILSSGIVPRRLAADALPQQLPGQGDHQLRHGAGLTGRLALRPALPQQQDAALQRQAGVAHHQTVQLTAELPVDLLGAVAGDILPQLEGIGKVVAGALLGIAVAVVADAGAQRQVQPQRQ